MIGEEFFLTVDKLTANIFSSIGFELIDCRLFPSQGKKILRIYIDRTDGKSVTIDDCAKVSHAVEDLFAVELNMEGSFNLEVSSPGIDRPLRRKRDFLKYLGFWVKLKTETPLDGRSNFKGELRYFDNDQLTVFIDGVEFKIPFEKVSEAHLVQGEILMTKQ
ncbi:MAG: ribosome maturation factor RimP [Pseudomonadota bacterium]